MRTAAQADEAEHARAVQLLDFTVVLQTTNVTLTFHGHACGHGR